MPAIPWASWCIQVARKALSMPPTASPGTSPASTWCCSAPATPSTCAAISPRSSVHLCQTMTWRAWLGCSGASLAWASTCPIASGSKRQDAKEERRAASAPGRLFARRGAARARGTRPRSPPSRTLAEQPILERYGIVVRLVARRIEQRHGPAGNARDQILGRTGAGLLRQLAAVVDHELIPARLPGVHAPPQGLAWRDVLEP